MGEASGDLMFRIVDADGALIEENSTCCDVTRRDGKGVREWWSFAFVSHLVQDTPLHIATKRNDIKAILTILEDKNTALNAVNNAGVRESRKSLHRG